MICIELCNHAHDTTLYSQVPNKGPLLFIDFVENDPLYKLLILFFVISSTIYSYFSKQIACFCICFSFILYDNLFMFFPSLCNHFEPFLNSDLPRLF